MGQLVEKFGDGSELGLEKSQCPILGVAAEGVEKTHPARSGFLIKPVQDVPWRRARIADPGDGTTKVILVEHDVLVVQVK